MSAISQKIQTTNSQTGLTNSTQKQAVRRRRTKLASEKKIADDEFMAAAIGDVKWLTQSLKDGGSVINYDKNGLAALHLAAIHGHLGCLKTCVEKFKIDVDLPSSTGWRAVHLCINKQNGNHSLDCLAYLIENGADCSVANDDGVTPAHQAASEGHAQCLKMLITANAKFDGKDCRGNTPLDFAKLWGHRFCARILAAEMWHQDKDYVAKEMQQLKKIKMQQVLKEFEEEEKMKEMRQLNGDEAFKQWMAYKHLPVQTAEQEREQYMENIKEGLYKVNGTSRINNETEQQETTKTKIPANIRNVSHGLKNNISDEQTDEKVFTRHCDKNDRKSKLEKPKKLGSNSMVHHRSDWIISAKATQNQYVPILDDDFPRDEYTMMPQVKGAPQYFEGKFIHPLTPDTVDEDVKKKGTFTKLRKPKLPQEIINSVLSTKSNASNRGMIFKCKHIEDVQMKKKFDGNKKGCSEAPLHLTNNINSHLVKNSVRISHRISSLRPDASTKYVKS